MSRTLHVTLWLGATCVALGVVGWIWELLARQAPSSPWHLVGFPAVIDRFASRAWIEGLTIFVLAPRAWRNGLAQNALAARAVLSAALVGSALWLGALAYAGATGVMGVQVRDASRTGRAVFATRATGALLLGGALALALRAALREPPEKR